MGSRRGVRLFMVLATHEFGTSRSLWFYHLDVFRRREYLGRLCLICVPWVPSPFFVIYLRPSLWFIRGSFMACLCFVYGLRSVRFALVTPMSSDFPWVPVPVEVFGSPYTSAGNSW